MWKRREEELPARPSSPPVPEPVREAPPPPPAKPSEPELPRGVAAIGKSVKIKGQIFSREDLYLDGEVEGTIEVPEHRLTVGPHGRLQASVKAREVVVLGSVNGNVEAAEKIDIRKEAKLVGDIKTGRIIIEDGAYFKGSIDIVREQPKAQAPQQPARGPAPPAQPAPSAPPGAAVQQASAAPNPSGDPKR
ncbi:MAG: polymer-forming cytoskeletal protein [Bryobacterales bacterium]|nr:polymer-forming cytoskeletal protein [Bryobacteraceae bacterium]MDW8130752.1 polymer-forming cytoskeletal protein [Bryobacterales bacterium]